MQECILDIQLFHDPSFGKTERKNKSNGRWFNHWTKSFIIVLPKNLCVPLCNQMCLEVIKCTIFLVFKAIDPFRAHNVDWWWSWNKMPCFIILKCLIFFIHSMDQTKVLSSSMISFWLCWWWCCWRGKCHVTTKSRIVTKFLSCYHWMNRWLAWRWCLRLNG